MLLGDVMIFCRTISAGSSLHGSCGEEAQREVFARKGRSAADAFAEEHRKACAFVAGSGKEFVRIPALALRKARKAV